jgi:hypothetical protein
MTRRLLTSLATPLVLTSIVATGFAAQPTAAIDHATLAASYTSEAKTLREQADTHELMLQRYEKAAAPAKGAPFPKAALTRHCRKLVAAYRQAANDAQALATMERALAEASPGAQ